MTCAPIRGSMPATSSTRAASADVRFSITVRLHKRLRNTIAAIPAERTGHRSRTSSTALTSPRPSTGRSHRSTRPAAHRAARARPTPGTQLALFVEFTYHAFITDRPGTTLALEADHRRHAEIENTIRDLKYGVWTQPSSVRTLRRERRVAPSTSSPTTSPAGSAALGSGAEGPPMTTKTLRTRLLDLPGRLTISGGKRTLHLPQGWPWEQQFSQILDAVCSVRLVT